MAGTDSIVGTSAEMPFDFYLKKVEQTCVFEPENLMENHFRNTLKDTSTDKPLFESDQIRYDNYSQDRLNLRHVGRRSELEPNLPDGTFLDHQFLEKDPRGTTTGPLMQKHRDQQFARAKFVKKYYDGDNSVPESGWHPVHIVRDIRNQFYNVKQRLQIFDTSKDSRTTPSAKYSGPLHSLKNDTIQDDRRPELRDSANYTRSRATEILSNSTQLGWRRIADHKFKVSKYGQVRGIMPLNQQNWSKNRGNVKLDHDVLLSWKDSTVNKSLSLKMIDLAQQKADAHLTGLHTKFEEGKDQSNRKAVLTSNDLAGMEVRESLTTQTDAPNILIKNEQSNRDGRRYIQQLDSKKMDKVVIDPEIINFMALSNKKLSHRDRDDLRKDIIKSNANYGVLMEQNNRKYNKDVNILENAWNSEDIRFKEESKKVFNYSTIKPENIPKIVNINFEDYAQKSKQLQNKKSWKTNDLYHYNAVKYDNVYGEEKTGTKLIGPRGNKNTLGLHKRENSMNDTESLTEVYAKN